MKKGTDLKDGPIVSLSLRLLQRRGNRQNPGSGETKLYSLRTGECLGVWKIDREHLPQGIVEVKDALASVVEFMSSGFGKATVAFLRREVDRGKDEGSLVSLARVAIAILGERLRLDMDFLPKRARVIAEAIEYIHETFLKSVGVDLNEAAAVSR